MTTKQQFIDTVRLRLNDPTSTRWADEEVAQYLRESLLRYAKLFPRIREVEGPIDATGNRIPVPSDLVNDRIQACWTIENAKLKSVPTKMMRARRSNRWFEVVGEEIVFGWTLTQGTIVRLRYAALHDIPETGEATIPSEDEDLIYLWVEYLAWRKIGASDANLARWREQGKRDDSPLLPHYLQLEKTYDKQVKERQGAGRVVSLVRQQPGYRGFTNVEIP